MLQINPLNLVRTFTEAFGQTWTVVPSCPGGKTSLLRVQLIIEEIGELVLALGAKNKVEVVDALTDIDYVTYGACGAFGTMSAPGQFVQPRIHDENWNKPFGELEPWRELALIHEIVKASNTLTMAISMVNYPDEKTSSDGLAATGHALLQLLQATSNAWQALGLEKYRTAAFLEVQRANMSKLGEDGKPILNESGRVVKGPLYKAPDLAAVVAIVDEASLETGHALA